MIPLGLTVSEQAEFHRTIKGLNDEPIDIDVRVHLLDMSERHVADLSSWLLGGQVVVEADGEVTRSCQVSLLDPERRAGIDPARPGESTHLNRMLSVSYGVWVPALERWVRVPVFRGPLTKASRAGDTLEVEALGKEHLLRNDAGWSKVYAAGLTRTGVIRDILVRSGERRYVVPSWKPRTGKTSVMPKIGTVEAKGVRNRWDRSHPWSWITAIARSMRAQAWYDGGGTYRMRQEPTRVSWWFTDSHLLSRPSVTIDDADVFNHVLVVGQPPDGKKWVVESYGSIPASHPNSPQKLGRNGGKRYLVDKIEDSEIRTQLDADRARDRRLNELVVTSYSVEFDCLPVPHLDPGDLCHLAWDEAPGQFRLKTFTLPLDGTAMSVGYARETRRTPAMIRAARRRSAVRRRQADRVKARRVAARKKARKKS